MRCSAEIVQQKAHRHQQHTVLDFQLVERCQDIILIGASGYGVIQLVVSSFYADAQVSGSKLRSLKLQFEILYVKRTSNSNTLRMFYIFKLQLVIRSLDMHSFLSTLRIRLCIPCHEDEITVASHRQ